MQSTRTGFRTRPLTAFAASIFCYFNIAVAKIVYWLVVRLLVSLYIVSNVDTSFSERAVPVSLLPPPFRKQCFRSTLRSHPPSLPSPMFHPPTQTQLLRLSVQRPLVPTYEALPARLNTLQSHTRLREAHQARSGVPSTLSGPLHSWLTGRCSI